MRLSGFQPAAQHASDFCAQRLYLEDFGGIGEVEFEIESEFEDGDFELTSGFDEVRCLERFWRILGHDEMFHAVENRIFEAQAERKFPPFLEFCVKVYDVFVGII